jgi:hypothetical protein
MKPVIYITLFILERNIQLQNSYVPMLGMEHYIKVTSTEGT